MKILSWIFLAGVRILNGLSYLRLSVPGVLAEGMIRFLWRYPDQISAVLMTIRPEALEHLSEKRVVWRFNRARKETPALDEFCAAHGIGRVSNIRDFRGVPVSTKENYVQKHPLEYRCWNGALPKGGALYESAGTSGKSTLWAESRAERSFFEQYVRFALEFNYHLSSKRYVILDCWAFGMWPTAIDFSQAASQLALVVNIGTSIENTINTLKTLGTNYNYIVVGYPPFLSHLLREGAKAGFVWKDWNIQVLSGGEGFVEEWRKDIKKYLGNEALVYSAYGSTDLGLSEGMESLATVTIRQVMHVFQTFLDDHQEATSLAKLYFPDVSISVVLPKDQEMVRALFLALFGVDPTVDRRLPMIFQYDPTTYYNEEVLTPGAEGQHVVEMLTTVIREHTAIPRVRYNVQDERGIIRYREMFEKFAASGIDIWHILESLGCGRDRILHLPFFYIFGRSDGTISVDGANIFPADVEELIADHEEFSGISSFIMKVTETHCLGIDFELKKDVLLSPKEELHLKGVFRKLFIQYSGGFKDIVEEKLPSSNLKITFSVFGTGPFENSPLGSTRLIKYKYIRK